MIRGWYTGASGMNAQQARLDAISNNLANVDTTGYKKDVAISKSFPELLMRRMNDDGVIVNELGSYDVAPVIGKLGLGVETNELYTIFEQGSFKETGTFTDMALSGEGFFAVSTPNGERYTRNGNFMVGKEGYLETKDGYPVLGENGYINVADVRFKVDADGIITDENGNEIIVFTITYSDGTVKYCTDGLGFVDDVFTDEYVTYSDNQGVDGEAWTVGGNNTATFEYMGVDCTYNVQIIENPVASIEYVSGSISLTEETGGYWSELYNEETGEYEEFFYYTSYSSNVMIKINYKDGSNKTGYLFDVVDGYYVNGYEEQYITPWIVGGENYMLVEYMGAKCTAPVTIVENPIESIEYVSGTVTVVENGDGRWDTRYVQETDSYEDFYYYYYDVWNVLVKLNYTDGTSVTCHIHSEIDGHVDDITDQYETPWVLGGDNKIIAECMGKTCEIPVTMLENPVDKIEVLSGGISLMENADGYPVDEYNYITGRQE